MAGRTVTRADLSEAVYQKVGLSRTALKTIPERNRRAKLSPEQRVLQSLIDLLR